MSINKFGDDQGLVLSYVRIQQLDSATNSRRECFADTVEGTVHTIVPNNCSTCKSSVPTQTLC